MIEFLSLLRCSPYRLIRSGLWIVLRNRWLRGIPSDTGVCGQFQCGVAAPLRVGDILLNIRLIAWGQRRVLQQFVDVRELIRVGRRLPRTGWLHLARGVGIACAVIRRRRQAHIVMRTHRVDGSCRLCYHTCIGSRNRRSKRRFGRIPGALCIGSLRNGVCSFHIRTDHPKLFVLTVRDCLYNIKGAFHLLRVFEHWNRPVVGVSKLRARVQVAACVHHRLHAVVIQQNILKPRRVIDWQGYGLPCLPGHAR